MTIPLCLRIMDFFSTSARDVKPYDRGELLSKLPFEMRWKIVSHLYLPTIKVEFVDVVGMVATRDSGTCHRPCASSGDPFDMNMRINMRVVEQSTTRFF